MTVRQAKTKISLGIRPDWSESSLCAQWVAKDPSFLHSDNEDFDQTGRMARLIWVFAGRTNHFVGLVMRRLIFRSSESQPDSSTRRTEGLQASTRYLRSFTLERSVHTNYRDDERGVSLVFRHSPSTQGDRTVWNEINWFSHIMVGIANLHK